MSAEEYIKKQAIPFMDGGCCGLDENQLAWHLNDYAALKSVEDNRGLVEDLNLLREDYQRRIQSAIKLSRQGNGSVNDLKREVRIETKVSEYRFIISNLDKIIQKQFK